MDQVINDNDYQQQLQKQFSAIYDCQNDTNINEKVEEIEKDFNNQIQTLKSLNFKIAKKGKKLSFVIQEREIVIDQNSCFKQSNSDKSYDNPKFYNQEIPKEYLLKGYNYFLPLIFDERLVVFQFKNLYEKDQLEKYLIWNDIKKNKERIIQQLIQKQSKYFYDTCIQIQFQKSLQNYASGKTLKVRNLLQTSQLFNNYDRQLCISMCQNIKQIVQRSGTDIQYKNFQKLEEFRLQEKKQSFNKNKFSFAMQQNMSSNITFCLNEIKLIFNYIDSQEYEAQEKPKIENPVLEISLQQTQQDSRQVNNQTISEQNYYKKEIKLNGSENRYTLKLDLVNNKIIQQQLILQEYDDQDIIKFKIIADNIQIQNQFPLYLIFDKFNIGQKLDLYLANGLYLNMETIYEPFEQKNIDSINKQKILNNEDLIDPIYCEYFVKLPQEYTSFLQEFYLQFNQQKENLDKSQSTILNSSKIYSQSQLIEIKYKKEYYQLILNIYNYQLNQISKEWIIKNDLIIKIENFIQNLYLNKKEEQIIKFTNFYQEINLYFDIMKDQSLYNEEILYQANEMLIQGLSNNLRLEFYRQYGQVYNIQKALIVQIQIQYDQQIQIDSLYEFIKGKIKFNCQLQQKLRDDISNFKSNIANSFKLWAYQALQSWVCIIQLFTFNKVQIIYGKYILQYAFKILQIIINHDFYRHCPNISEELIFWLILCQSIFFNFDFQQDLKQLEEDIESKIIIRDLQDYSTSVKQRFKINQKIHSGLFFLRFSIRNHFSKIYELIDKYKINIEILFCNSLQQLCFDLLNSNINYRILDIAYGLIQEGLGYFHFAIIMAIMSFFEDYINHINSYQSFIDIFKFTAQNIYQVQDFVNLVLHYRVELDQDYPDFVNQIKGTKKYYEQFNYKQEAIEQLIYDQKSFDLIDAEQIIGSQKNNTLEIHNNLKIEPNWIHVFVNNPTHQEVYVQVQEILKQTQNGYIKLKFEDQLKFVANDKVIFQINCKSLPLNVLVQQTTIANIQFSLMIEASKFRLNTIENVLRIPNLYYEDFLLMNQEFTFQNKIILERINNDISCNAQNVYVDQQLWKKDSFQKQQKFQTLMQNSDILKQNQHLDKFWQTFDNTNFYLKEFLIYIILNSSGTLKQKMHSIYSNFKCLYNNQFHFEIMLALLTEIFHIFKIPILQQELLNSISYIQYKSVNKIKVAKLERGDKNIDITDMLQRYLDMNFMKFGAQSIFLDDLKTIIYQYKDENMGTFNNSQNIIQENMKDILESNFLDEQESKISNKDNSEQNQQVDKDIQIQQNGEQQQKLNTQNYYKQQKQQLQKGFSQNYDQQQNFQNEEFKQRQTYQPQNDQQNIDFKQRQTFQSQNLNSEFINQDVSQFAQKINDFRDENSDNPLMLSIDYDQNFQSRSIKYQLTDDYKIKVDSKQDKNILNINILNLNFSYQDIEFWEFWKVCNDLQLLNNTVLQDHSLNQNSQKSLLECRFLINVEETEISQIKFKQEFQNKLIMLNLAEYEQNLKLYVEFNNYQINDQQQLITTDQLDILLPFKHLYKQITNILILHHLEKPIQNLKNANLLKQPKIIFKNEVTPSGIMDLSLLDIQQITQKSFKDLDIELQFENLNNQDLKINSEIIKNKYQL